MRVVLTGGGTGGHVYPAIAIARDLQQKVSDVEIMYIGTNKGLESDIVPKEGLRFATVEVESLPRKLSLKTLHTAFKLMQGLWGARKLIAAFKPDVVVGTGGYVCGPVVFIAAMMGIPAVIHEQNALPGITNKLLSRYAKVVLMTFPESKKYFPASAKTVLTGLPIRPGILTVNREQGSRAFGLDPHKFTVLVTGGSRGARSLNLAMVETLAAVSKRDDLQIIMATGTATHQEFMTKVKEAGIDLAAAKHFVVKPYIYKMEEALAAADLCVCRAGAAFLSELLAKGKPSILIPYPYAAENHQEYNARSVVNQGGAILILDKDLDGKRLLAEIEKLAAKPEIMRQMAEKAQAMGKPEALEQITAAILTLVNKTAR
ncbi:MAG TPA: undecaprenyldiphospho-muramoylpentapeptide beta-N-acetylglucosaminyltransferase [Desulfobacteria bacterium]|nr:undecaprenyldiphospho-muramoylpentapeptide beta-N-acetylglucosaminyltransferase [Desulfobacteria bacterium]